MLKNLKDILEHGPFRPFRTALTNGDRYEALNPHLIAMGESQLFYCFPPSDRFAFLRMNQIAALQTLQSAT